VQKLRRAGVDPGALVAVVITHIHPDHAYGLPALIRNLSVLGRQAPLTSTVGRSTWSRCEIC